MSAAPALASAPGQDTAEDAVSSGDCDSHYTNDPCVTIGAQHICTIHFHEKGEAKPGAASSAPPVRKERLSVAPGRSLWSIKKAGPGNNTDQEPDSCSIYCLCGWGEIVSVRAPVAPVVLCKIGVFV